MFMPWAVVNNWLCQYFSLCHKISSMFVALLQTCSIIWTDKNWKILLSFLDIPLTYFAVPHLSLLVLISLLYILKRFLKLVAEPTYCCTQFLQVDNVIITTMKDSPCIISSISDTACEIIRTHQIIFANVTFVTTSDRIGSINFVVWV